jgi:hypothetical protein
LRYRSEGYEVAVKWNEWKVMVECKCNKFLTMHVSLLLLFSVEYQLLLLLVVINCNFSIDD